MKLSGLSQKEAQEALLEHGPNRLPEDPQIPIFVLFLKQFRNFFTAILSAAALFSLWHKDWTDGLLIIAILILNAGLSFWQEYKSSKEMEALKTFSESTSRVVREGKEIEIPSDKLVPGDIVILESGSKIPADGLILEAHALSVDESALTGESASIYKSTEDNSNLLFYSSTVLTGKAYMKVAATGLKTRFGMTVEHLETLEEEKTPLEIALNTLAKNIGIGILAVSVFLLLFNLFTGKSFVTSLFTSIALFVAAVPEGLPAVITVVLALGVRRLYAKKTLVRRMGAVESLGATNVICTDKTGTLTKNEMRVQEVILLNEDKKIDFIKTSIICNNSSLAVRENGGFDVLGDTTEGALLVWCKEQNLDIEIPKKNGNVIDEQPFDSVKKTMAVLFEEDGKRSIYAKGAFESMIELCDLSTEEKDDLSKKNEELAKKGLRVLLLAKKETHDTKINLADLTYLGLAGIADSPREGVDKVIASARQAGIEVVMITGDNPVTAKAIAEKIGLLRDGEEILTGDQLDSMPDQELVQRLDRIRIYARTTPEHKIRIVTAFQSTGKVTAVTGDGVNDSLALKKSNIGVAMGITGTDVAKEASDIIILNDNFVTLVEAIEQGRTIYANIVKVVRFLFASNFSEVFVVAVIVLLGTGVPLLPVQLLWINLVSDGLPALGLTASKSGKGIMSKTPRNIKEPILNKNSLIFILTGGIVMGVVNVVLFYFGLNLAGLTFARGILFTSIVMSQMIFVFVVSGKKNIFENKYLLASVVFIILLQIAIITIPATRGLFKL